MKGTHRNRTTSEYTHVSSNRSAKGSTASYASLRPIHVKCQLEYSRGKVVKLRSHGERRVFNLLKTFLEIADYRDNYVILRAIASFG